LSAARTQVAVVGSGFAGALLARLLAHQGLHVTLIERGQHPRFAIGESSTPLASLCLERLAARYGQPDLHHLAAHGRWLRHLPALRRGLKRGFTFYRHRPGRPYANDTENGARLLVAASPSDRVADTHWLRADVDHHLVRQAVAAGVDYQDRTRVTAVEAGTRGVRLELERDRAAHTLRADFLVDATGPGGLLRRALRIPLRLARTSTRSFLLYGHFAGARLFADVAAEAGTPMPPGPYPEDWAAQHHLTDEGWMYVLRYDHDLVSAGLLATPRGVRRLRLDARGAEPGWRALMARYPSIGTQFADARPLFPLRYAGRVQHRLARATGPRWALLPHSFAFVDALFSTGIAWGLLAVERLAEAFADARSRGRTAPSAAALERYETLLAAEADQIDTLVAGAYAAMSDFSLFAAHSMLYFGVVSFAETRQRLVGGTAWDAFLAADDPEIVGAYRKALRWLSRATPRDRAPFAGWVAATIAPRNVAGLADPARRNMYPVDLDVLVERAPLLGLTAADVRRALPRLRR
jgi:tetracycline 7-halogenase / FADH2 O2-dependent halogenase